MGYFHFTPTFHFQVNLLYDFILPTCLAFCFVCPLLFVMFACLLRSRNIRRDRSFLHEDTRPEPVLRSRVRTPIVKT